MFYIYIIYRQTGSNIAPAIDSKMQSCCISQKKVPVCNTMFCMSFVDRMVLLVRHCQTVTLKRNHVVFHGKGARSSVVFYNKGCLSRVYNNAYVEPCDCKKQFLQKRVPSCLKYCFTCHWQTG